VSAPRVKVVREQVAACLASDLDERAKVAWVFLYLCKGGGVGTARLGQDLQMTPRDAEVAVEVLKERGVVRRHNGVWRADPFLVHVETRTPEERAAENTPAHFAAVSMLAHYEEVKEAKGFGPVLDHRQALAVFRCLAVWLSDHSVPFDRWLEWAVEKTAYMKGKIPFPPPSLVAGPWLQGQWLNGVDGSRRDPSAATSSAGHAGHTYREPVGLKKRLLEAGFERAAGFGKSELRHILQWAENMVALPVHYELPDPDYAAEILWVRDRLKERADAEAS